MRKTRRSPPPIVSPSAMATGRSIICTGFIETAAVRRKIH
jgi:hypothetical protein